MTTRPVALVTGCSSGIGLRTAIGLARSGMHVVATVATMRDTSRDGRLCDAAAGAGVELDVRALDVTDRRQARACVDGVMDEYGAIGALMNNAGVGLVGMLEELNDAALPEQLEVNYLAVRR